MNMETHRFIAPLVVSGLTKHYDGERGIEDVTFDVKAGEVFGFLGPNGAGKTTTIRTIIGFLSASKGSVSIFGETPSAASRSAIGYLSGDFSAYEHMSGRDFVNYLGSLSRTIDWDYVHSLTDRFDATLDTPIHTLSKGNKQKIGIIQAMMHQPSLLILDEPTSGLDPLVKQTFYDLLRETRMNQTTTIFVSSHDLTEVQKICDRAGFIRDGKLIAIETIHDIAHLSARRFVITLASKPNNTLLAKLRTLSKIERSDNQLTCTVTGAMREFLSAVSLLDVSDLHEQSLSLEEIFMHYYQAEDNTK